VIGAAAITAVGFSSLGWTLGSTAEQMAADRAQTAVVGVLTPICVEKFQHQANAGAKLAEFNKSSSWDRPAIIEKGGWATVPGSDTPNSAVARACAERLGSPLQQSTTGERVAAPMPIAVHFSSRG
jgi:hypothetical protein